DRLLRIAARGEVPARRIERVREGRGDRGPRRVGIAGQRRNRMADPGDGPEPREEPEERGTQAGAELEPLALAQELPVRVLIADHEGPLRRLVHDRDGRLQLPASREKRGQVDPRLPVDRRAERLVEEHPTAPTRDGRVWDTRPFPTSWLRLPPTLNVPQSNCLVKFTCDVRLAVARNGFTVLV